MLSLEEELQKINHSRERRNYFIHLLINTPLLLPKLWDVCYKVDDEISCRATWGLEFLCREDINYILPYLEQFITLLPQVHQHPAVRPMAKICEYLTESYYHKNPSAVKTQLSTSYRQKITEICFDWLITDQKVATKAYGMTCLYLLGTEFDWVHPELKIILENNYHSGSAAYKARSRMILKKLK